MTKYKVQITDKAMEDLAEIYNYISSEFKSKETAKCLYERIVKRVLMLDYLPYRYPVLNISILEYKDIRLMPVDNFSVLYVCRDEEVIVVAVLYSGANIKQRLKKLTSM